jgi:hypothetical protein
MLSWESLGYGLGLRKGNTSVHVVPANFGGSVM